MSKLRRIQSKSKATEEPKSKNEHGKKDLLSGENQKEKEMKKIVDECLGLQTDIKEKTTQFDTNKKDLKEYAKDRAIRFIFGDTAHAEFIDGSSTEPITPSALLKIMRAEKKMHLFDSVLKVSITDAKKYLGEDAIQELTVITKIPCQKVKISKNKEPK